MKKLIVNDQYCNFEYISRNTFIVDADVIYFTRDEHIGWIWKANTSYDDQFLISIGRAIEKQYPELIDK